MTRNQYLVAVGAAATVLLTGCGSDTNDQTKEAAETARIYQEAVLAQDYPTACEIETDRLRRETVEECIERSKTFPERRATTGPVTTGETVELQAIGDHPAGIGVAVSFDYTSGESSGTAHNAVRVVEDEDGTWRVDQATDLDGTVDEAAVRYALHRE